MKIVIQHSKTSREINGPFSMCISRKHLEEIKDVIEEKLRSENGHNYGWIHFDEYPENVDDSGFLFIKRQAPIVSATPITWDAK